MLVRTYLNLISVHGRLIGSFALLGFLTGDIYTHFLQNELAEFVILALSMEPRLRFFFYLESKGIFRVLSLQWKEITLISLLGEWVVVVNDIDSPWEDLQNWLIRGTSLIHICV